MATEQQDKPELKVRCQVKTSRRRTPLGGGQNDTRKVRIIFWLEWAELSVCLYMRNHAILSLLTNQSEVRSYQIHVFFLVAQDAPSSESSLFASWASTNLSLLLDLLLPVRKNIQSGPVGPWALFDWHKHIDIFLGKASLDIKLARRAIYASVKLTLIIHWQISQG